MFQFWYLANWEGNDIITLYFSISKFQFQFALGIERLFKSLDCDDYFSARPWMNKLVVVGIAIIVSSKDDLLMEMTMSVADDWRLWSEGSLKSQFEAPFFTKLGLFWPDWPEQSSGITCLLSWSIHALGNTVFLGSFDSNWKSRKFWTKLLKHIFKNRRFIAPNSQKFPVDEFLVVMFQFPYFRHRKRYLG